MYSITAYSITVCIVLRRIVLQHIMYYKANLHSVSAPSWWRCAPQPVRLLHRCWRGSWSPRAPFLLGNIKHYTVSRSSTWLIVS